MFSVVDDKRALKVAQLERYRRCGDDFKILFRAEYAGLRSHASSHDLPKIVTDRSLRTQQRLDALVIRTGNVLSAGRAEGRDPRMLQIECARLFKEVHVARVRARPTAFDEIHPQGVKLPRDAALVLGREVNALALRTVT